MRVFFRALEQRPHPDPTSIILCPTHSSETITNDSLFSFPFETRIFDSFLPIFTEFEGHMCVDTSVLEKNEYQQIFYEQMAEMDRLSCHVSEVRN